MNIKDLTLRVIALFRPRKVERDLGDELAFHIACETRKLMTCYGTTETTTARQAIGKRRRVKSIISMAAPRQCVSDSMPKIAGVLAPPRSFAAIMTCVPQAPHRSALVRTAVDLLARAGAGGEPLGSRGRSSSRDSIGACAGTPRARDSRALQELRFRVRSRQAVEAVTLSGVQEHAAFRADAADRQDPALTCFEALPTAHAHFPLRSRQTTSPLVFRA